MRWLVATLLSLCACTVSYHQKGDTCSLEIAPDGDVIKTVGECAAAYAAMKIRSCGLPYIPAPVTVDPVNEDIEE
jgi:uncharacterized protein YfaQ (DUF2300 family)